MCGNPGGLSDDLFSLLSACQATGYSVRRLSECQALPAQSDGFASSLAGMPGNWLLCQTVAGMPDAAGSVRRLNVAKSSNRRFCHTVSRKFFDCGRSALMLIPQIRTLGSCFVEFLQSSFRYFLIDDAFFLTIMFQVVLLTEYHASNRTECLHQFSIYLLQKAKTKI